MDTYAVFILTHEDLSYSLVRTVEKIVGKQENVYPFSNKTEASSILFQKITDQIKALNKEHYIMFVDLVGGSCWSLANMIHNKNPYLTVIGGVNLSMLVSFFVNHKQMEYSDLIDKVVADSHRGIILIRKENQDGSAAV